jgi:hypothetical protein
MMLTLVRFRALADSYGADLRRWPEEVRGDAQALFEVCAEARRLLQAARALDEAIASAGTRDVLAQAPGEADAALVRLLARVDASILAAPSRRLPRTGRRSDRTLASWRSLHLNPRWIGMASVCSLAVAGGLWLGLAPAPPLAPDALFAMLQLLPVQVTVE